MKHFLPVILILSVFIFSCKKKEDDTATPEPQRKVEYKIDCVDCTVIYYDSKGNDTSVQHVNSSWSYKFNGAKDQIVLLTAINTQSVPAGVAATIYLNDDTLQHHVTYCPVSGTVLVIDTLQ